MYRNYIYKISNGDLRKAITLLQYINIVYGSKYNKNNIDNILGILPTKLLNKYIKIIKSDIKNIDTICTEIYNLGYCNIYIISQIYNNILLLDIEDNKKSKIIYYIYECKVDLYKKCNFYICLLNMSYNIADYLIWI